MSVPTHYPVPEGEVWRCRRCDRLLQAPSHYYPEWVTARTFYPLCGRCNAAYQAEVNGRIV